MLARLLSAGLSVDNSAEISVFFRCVRPYQKYQSIPFCESVIANGRIDFHEIILNVVAFVPFGVFAYVLWQEKSFLSQILPVFLTSLGFEVIQFIFAIGATDITDLITNTSGGVIGIGIAFVLSKIFKNSWKKCINIVGLVCAVLLSLFILVLLLANL